MLLAAEVPNNAPRKGIVGIDRIAVGRSAGRKGAGAALNVVFERAYSVRITCGMEGRRMYRVLSGKYKYD